MLRAILTTQMGGSGWGRGKGTPVTALAWSQVGDAGTQTL